MIIFSLSYPLSTVTTDNGRVLAIFIISGWKSILSCRFGARLILMIYKLFVSVHLLLTIIWCIFFFFLILFNHSTNILKLLPSYCRIVSKTICCHTVKTWLLFRWRNSGILEFLKTRYIVFASLTYLDSFNIHTLLWF